MVVLILINKILDLNLKFNNSKNKNNVIAVYIKFYYSVYKKKTIKN